MMQMNHEELPNNLLTLSLEGDVPLALFAQGMKNWSDLVKALTSEVAGKTDIEWFIEHLQAGSATTSVLGVSDSIESVERVVEAYLTVGQALSRGSPVPYPRRIEQKAIAITELLNGKVTAVHFMTPRQDFTVTHRYLEGLASPQMVYSYGVLKGTVETISRRRGFTFTLYDALFDKAVTCYLAPTHADTMRDVWGRKALVFGQIGRDPQTGRPVSIKRVVRVEVLKDAEPGQYRLARGIFRGALGDTLPEDAVRRMRDD